MQRAELGDAVFHVVERVQKDVELTVPEILPRRFVAGPVHIAAEAAHQPAPRRSALGARVTGMAVNPMLKSVHRGHPREEGDDAFEVRLARAVRVGGGVEFLEVLVAEEFHCHRGDFAELNRSATVGVEVFALRGERVEGVAGFVDHGLDVALNPDGVHEDEGQPGLGERGLVAARGFAFAVGKVEELKVAHRLEAVGEARFEVVEDALGARVKEVRVTLRLTDSPACLVADEHDIGGNFARILRAAGQKVPTVAPILEINPQHPLVQRLEKQESRFADWSALLFEQALLAEGGELEDAAGFVKRMNENILILFFIFYFIINYKFF